MKTLNGITRNKAKIGMTAMVLAVILVTFAVSTAYADTVDQREYAHGMNFVYNPVTQYTYLIWSDAYKDGVMDNGSWTHDVYCQEIDTAAPKLVTPDTLVSAYEAQEPASASAAGDGGMIVTFEDGNDAGDYEVCQRYVLYDKDMNVIKSYPQTIAMGGHSGHCASTDDRHVIFWSQEWVDGGGVSNLGTGRDVYVTSMKTDGSDITTKPVSVDNGKRDWWPIIAASDSKTLLVWQRYINSAKYAHICYALYDPKTCTLSATHVITTIKASYYRYNVSYAENADRFVIGVTDTAGAGNVLLIDENGRLTGRKAGLPGFVRESSPAIRDSGSGSVLVYPKAPTGAFSLKITGKSVRLLNRRTGNYRWTICGTSGFYADDGSVYFVNLGTSKVRLVHFR